MVVVAPGAIGFRATEMVVPEPLAVTDTLEQVQCRLVKAGGTLSVNTMSDTGSLPAFFTVNVNVTGPPAKTFGETVLPTRIETQPGSGVATAAWYAAPV